MLGPQILIQEGILQIICLWVTLFSANKEPAQELEVRVGLLVSGTTAEIQGSPGP